jgi:hypothetical protein
MQPGPLMSISSEFPALGFDQFRVASPELLERRD